MPANQWVPPRVGDPILDRSFSDLSSRLAGIDSILASVVVPTVRIARESVTIADELYMEYRGVGGHVVTLPDASSRGQGRGSLITIQNFGTGAITIRAFSRNFLNGATDVLLAPDEGALCSGNGVAKWTAIKPAPPPVAAGHVIQDEGTPLTQRANLNFAGAGVTATDDSGNDATLVTIPGTTTPTTRAMEYSVVDVCVAGFASTTNVSGNQTCGAAFFNSRAIVIPGIRFYWKKNGANKTINVALWTINSNTTGTKIANVDVAVNATGAFTGTFGSAQSMAANSRWMVSMWEKGGAEFTAGGHSVATGYDAFVLGYSAAAANGDRTALMCGHGIFHGGYFVAGANTYPGTAAPSAIGDRFYPVEPVINDITL